MKLKDLTTQQALTVLKLVAAFAIIGVLIYDHVIGQINLEALITMIGSIVAGARLIEAGVHIMDNPNPPTPPDDNPFMSDNYDVY